LEEVGIERVLHELDWHVIHIHKGE
jgi:hypothetical protein